MNYVVETRFPWTPEQEAYLKDVLATRINGENKLDEAGRALALEDLAELGPRRTWMAVKCRAYHLKLVPIDRSTEPKKPSQEPFTRPDSVCVNHRVLGQIPVEVWAWLQALCQKTPWPLERFLEAMTACMEALMVNPSLTPEAIIRATTQVPEAPGPWGDASKADMWQALGIMHTAAEQAVGASGQIGDLLGRAWLSGELPVGIRSDDAVDAMGLAQRAAGTFDAWPCFKVHRDNCP